MAARSSADGADGSDRNTVSGLHLVLTEGQACQEGALPVEDAQGQRVALTPSQQQRLVDELRALRAPRDATRFYRQPAEDDSAADDDDEDDLERKKGSLVLHAVQGRKEAFRVRHLVGSACLPCGITLEVLPKIMANGDADAQRRALRRMWSFAADLATRSDRASADLEAERQPLHKWLAMRFLDELDLLIRRGLRAHYVEHEDNLTTLRGRLLVQQNMRANALAPYRFFCRHEQFSLDRPENRLIRSALRKLAAVDDGDCRRRAAGLSDRLHEIPFSRDIPGDFGAWRDDRCMIDYREIRSTAEWILGQLGPAPVAGGTRLFGRFVRMNDVFERYVARWLQERLPKGWQVILQAGSLSDKGKFATYAGKTRQLHPDIVITNLAGVAVAVLDTKWKHCPEELAYADLYQLYAYATHFLDNAHPRLAALVYPAGNHDDGVNEPGFAFPRLTYIEGRRLRFCLQERENAADTTSSAPTGRREGLVMPRGSPLPCSFFGTDDVWFPGVMAADPSASRAA